MLRLLLIAILTLPIFAAPEWTLWRGPEGTGHYNHETTWSHDWPAAGPKQLWSQEALKGSLIVSRNKLIILTNNGSLVIANASPEGFTELARHSGLGKRTWAPPVLHEGRLYVRDADGWATCLDLRPNEKK